MWRDEQGARAKEYRAYFKPRVTQGIVSQGVHGDGRGFETEPFYQEFTETQREVLMLFEVQGMSGEEISGTLGIKLNTVWSHLKRARERMQVTFDDMRRREGKPR